MKMTKQRKLILELLKTSKKPINAEMIYQKLPDQSMNLSTIYRTLEKFFDEGLISKSFLNQTNYYYYNLNKHHHYMICISCHDMIEIDCHLDHFAHEVADEHEFKITHHDMTLYGYCKTCQAHQA